jgi:Secretion system C-terminal sorting domain
MGMELITNFRKNEGLKTNSSYIKRVFSTATILLISTLSIAQNVTISSSGETGTTGTNWSISGNVLSVTGTASVNASVITNHLTTVGDLEILANSAMTSQQINIDAAIDYSGSTARTLTFVARNDVKVNQAITASNSTLHIFVKAGDNIDVASSVSMASNGGNIVFWANTDGNNLGNIAVQPTTSIVSNDGGIWMGGGQSSTQWVPFDGATSITVGAASAISGTANPFGVVIRGAVNAGTGNFYASGVSNKTGTDYSTGVFFDANPDNVNIQAKNIRIIGQGSPNTGTAHSNRGVVLEIAANKTGTIQATSELYLEGMGSGTSSSGSYNRGIHLSKNSTGTATITAPTIYFKGTGAGANGSNFNDGVSLLGITLGNSQTTNITLEGVAGAFGAGTRAINFQENVSIGNQSSSATIQLLGNSFAYNNSVIATQGSVSILSTTNSFSGTCSNASLSITGSPSSITIGKPTNTASVTISNPLTAAGSITIIGGLLNVGSVITSSNTGDITMKSNVTNSGATSSLFTNAQILKTGGQRSKVLMQCNGRLNFGTSAKIEATNTALDAIFWSDFDNSNDDGGTTVYGDIITNGGHVWIGGSNSTGGAVTWNGLTVGDGPSIGTLGSTNWNALDLGSNITTSGGDMFIWSGSGHSSGISGIEVYNGDRNLNAGSGDVTIITNAGVRGAALRVNTSGKIAIAPNATSFSASTFNFNGTLSGNDFIGTNSMDKINILNYAAVNQLSLGYYTNANGWNFANTGTLTINTDIVTNGSVRLNANTINLNANLKTQVSGNLYLKGNTTVAVGKYIQCAGNFTQDGNILFKSDATATASFGTLGGTYTTTSGTVTVERYIPARRAFRFLSPSVTTTTSIRQNWQENGGSTGSFGTHITGATGASAGFDVTETNNPSMFTFTNGIWDAVTNTNSNVLTAGSPFRLMVRGDRTISMATNTPTPTPTILRATGILKTGDFTPTINQTSDGLSFIGNPYQAPVDIKAVLNASTNMNTNVAYYWDPTLNARGGYVTRTLSANTNDVTSSFNEYLQPGQAVIVKRNNTSNAASMLITEANKSVTQAAAGAFRNANTSEYGILRVNLQANTNNQWATIEGTLALFNDDFSWDVTSEDATKLTNLDEEISFVQNNTNLAIALQSNPSTTSELPIKIDKMRHTNYQWQFELNNYSGATPYLFDTLNNSYTQINNGTVMPFTADSNTSNRFKVVFQNALLSTDTFQNTIDIYPNPAKAGASFNIEGISEAVVTVYNLLGQAVPVQTKNQGNTLQVTPNTNLSQGVYLVTIATQGNTQQIKWIVE